MSKTFLFELFIEAPRTYPDEDYTRDDGTIFSDRNFNVSIECDEMGVELEYGCAQLSEALAIADKWFADRGLNVSAKSAVLETLSQESRDKCYFSPIAAVREELKKIQ